MNYPSQTLELKFERTIAAQPDEVFDAWLNPEIPGTPWNEKDDLIFDPRVDGFFYWLASKTAHYGRFTEISRPGRIQHTWMSRYTMGEESMVTLTFEKQGTGTLMTLVHSDLPDFDEARKHEQGWNYFLDKLVQHLGSKAGVGK